MAGSRKLNAIRNTISGIAMRGLDMIMSFVMRTVLLYTLGVEYLGLSGLFTSVINILNLAELGISYAMVYAMYEPIAQKNTQRVCAILNLYRKCYGVIGAVVGVLGLCLIPLLKYLVKGEVPQDISLLILYLINLGATVFNYWVFGYKKSLLNALQRSDINSKIVAAGNLARYVVQIVLLVLFRNYYLYFIVAFISYIAINLAVEYTTKTKYPQYKPEGKLPPDCVQDIKKRVKALFISKLGSVVLTSVDTVVISSFLGLVSLAVYQNYYNLVFSVQSVMWNVTASITASIGDSLVSESMGKNVRDLHKITMIYSGIIAVCACCFMTMFQPFITLWMGKELLLPYSMVLCFVLFFVLYGYFILMSGVKDAAGAWYNDRYRPFVSSVLNLSLNLLTVRAWGLYGIVLSTVVSLLVVELPWMAKNLFTVIYPKSELKPYLKRFFACLGSIFLSCAVSYLWVWLSGEMNVWIRLIGGGFFGVGSAALTFFLIYGRSELFRESIRLVIPDKILKKLKKDIPVK